MRIRQLSLAILVSTLSFTANLFAEETKQLASSPPRDGLCLWLDAADSKTTQIDDGKQLNRWADKSGRGHHALLPANQQGPVLVPDSLGGKPVLRFKGKSSLPIEGALEDLDTLTVFIVFRRPPELAGERKWQRLLYTGPDKEGTLFNLGESTGAESPTVKVGSFKKFAHRDLVIGGDGSGRGGLLGDIAEIVAYDRQFFVDDQVREVTDYLEKKWGFQIDRTKNWTRGGPLGTVPERKNPALPLSDQENAGKWVPYPAMTDDFEGAGLDSAKWWDHNPSWYGRAPGRFLARNVTITDGELGITMRKDPDLPEEDLYGNGNTYHTWSSGSIVSKAVTAYGYFEIEAKPMNSAGSSAWWFTGRSEELEKGGRHAIEIDVFEIGGKTPGKENSLNMNLHVFETPEEKRHWSLGDHYLADFRLADDYHVYGLEWTPDTIRYFLDGSLVRSVKNTHWHAPMNMLFDSETMFDWLGEPPESDLPSTFKVRYVRAWKNPATDVDWSRRFKSTRNNPDAVSKITRYIRSLDP